jgi:hypothetical protein
MMSAELFTEPGRNKTELTHAVTEAVVRYLDGLGFKPVETEVPICEGWVADAAGVSEPTYTEAVNMKLIEPYPKRDYGRWQDAEYMAGYNAACAIVKAAYDALPCPLTALVEVKTSRADFRGDKKWEAAAPTNLCFVATPRGMLGRSEYPKGWHVLEVDAAGRVRTAHRGELFAVPVERQLRTVLNIAIRRDHFTRHARLRAQRKVERDQINERQTLTRVSSAVRAVMQIVKAEGESVEQVLFWRNIKRLPAHVVDELRDMWGAAVRIPNDSQP